jgi:hypothetical protein
VSVTATFVQPEIPLLLERAPVAAAACGRP